MKHVPFIVAVTVLMAAASCSKEVNPVVENDQPVVENNQLVSTVQKMTFTAYADNGDETRTSLSADNKVNWAAGESIYVFDGKAPRKFVANEGGSVVTFSGEADQAGTYYAVSPAATMTGTTINATIPVFQTATAGTYDPKAAISVAVSNTNPNGTNELKFKNAAALVKFQISDENVTKIRLDAINGKKLAGKATITLESDNTPTLQMVDSEAESCVILQPASGAFNTGTDYVIAIAPGTYAGGFKLTLIKSDNKYASFSNTSSQTLDRSAIMNFGTLPAVKTWKETLQEFTDVITPSLIGVTSTSYSQWDGLQCANSEHSEAVYAGQSAGSHSSIQLRATSPSGIVSSTSGGTVKSVTVVWNTNTVDGRELEVFGSNTAYDEWDAADLYNQNKDGDYLGSIVKGSSTSTLTITGVYKYIGLRSKENAMYLDKISIVWEAAGGSPYEEPTVTPSVFQVLDQTPATGTLPATNAEGSFKVKANVPWNLTVDNESAVDYELTTNGDITTVSAVFANLGESESTRTVVFTITPSEGTAQEVTFVQSKTPDPETIDLSQKGFEYQEVISVVEGNNFSISFNKGTNSTTPKYYNDSVRIYGGGYFTVSSNYTIKTIEITFGDGDGSNTISSDAGSYANGVWRGSASSVKFTIGGTSGHRRIKAINVTFQ